VVYPNHIKRISAYVIKLLAYTKVLKNATLPSLILQIEVLVEVHFKVIARRSAIFIKN